MSGDDFDVLITAYIWVRATWFQRKRCGLGQTGLGGRVVFGGDTRLAWGVTWVFSWWYSLT